MTLKIDRVTKRFGSFTAVNELSLEVERGSMFGMLGANGAGKTTTFRLILGLLHPTDGKISWNGKAIDIQSSHLIGYLPEERGLYPKLKVADQLIYLGRLRGMTKEEIVARMHHWLNVFNVPEYANKKVEELSKGNQQKIQFIASVIHNPDLLILDEPFSGLDPVNVELLKEAVLQLNQQGTTILFSSHRMDHVEELCENLCILHHGRPVVEGRLREIKRSFGKKNISIRTDFDMSFIESFPGVLKVKSHKEGAEIQIEKEETAQELLKVLAMKGFVRKFMIEDPSLHDIFIEKVGSQYE